MKKLIIVLLIVFSSVGLTADSKVGGVNMSKADMISKDLDSLAARGGKVGQTIEDKKLSNDPDVAVFYMMGYNKWIIASQEFEVCKAAKEPDADNYCSRAQKDIEDANADLNKSLEAINSHNRI